LTPATLTGVSGRPTLASAVSRDNEGVFAGDHSTENGAAVHSNAAAIVTPIKLSLFMTLLLLNSYSTRTNRQLIARLRHVVDLDQINAVLRTPPDAGR
jgi:hypothetical protein